MDIQLAEADYNTLARAVKVATTHNYCQATRFMDAMKEVADEEGLGFDQAATAWLGPDAHGAVSYPTSPTWLCLRSVYDEIAKREEGHHAEPHEALGAADLVLIARMVKDAPCKEATKDDPDAALTRAQTVTALGRLGEYVGAQGAID